MILRCGTHPRLLPLLLILLLLTLYLSAHTAEAKKKVKKGKAKQPAAAANPVTVDIDAQPPPSSLQSDALLDATADYSNIGPEGDELAMAIDWTQLAPNTNTSSPTAATAANDPSINAPSHSSITASPTASSSSSALFYPLVALGAVTSTLGLAYLYYRFLRAKSTAPPPAFDAIPLLRLLPANHPAGRPQGSDWAVQQLRWDADGDCAHDFLGPFVFAGSGGGVTSGDGQGNADVVEEKVMQQQTAGGADTSQAAKKARKKG